MVLLSPPLRLSRSVITRSLVPRLVHVRLVSMSATQTQTQTEVRPPPPAAQGKREGDISDSFASLSGTAYKPLPQKFLDLKKRLIRGNEDAVVASWGRLLEQLKIENEIVAREGPNAVPSIEFKDLDSNIAVLRSELKKRGVAVIRGVVPEDEARRYKTDLEEYVKKNPHTRGMACQRNLSSQLLTRSSLSSKRPSSL